MMVPQIKFKAFMTSNSIQISLCGWKNGSTVNINDKLLYFQIMKHYNIQKIIGQGAFGNAYLASHLFEGKKYVIKKVDLTNKTTEQTENIFNEVKLLQAFKHINIVSYRESIIQAQELNIIMEFCAGGDLNQLIMEQKDSHNGCKLEEQQIIDWATQIALAIFYMHDKRILHRDLKTPNIFITYHHVKLGDFGISKVLDEKVDLASTSIGTPYYMSPEQYRHKPYSYKSDIWAFGCILYEMCNQKRPFEAFSLNGLAVKVLEANFAPVSQFYSKQLRELVKRMLQKKEKDRPSILEFLQTPIIRKRVINYLREVYEKLVTENGDKDLLEGVLYQAKKLGISMNEKEQLKKSKPEFSAEKKKAEKERIRQQLEEDLRKISEKNKKDKQDLKRLEEDRKNLLKGHSHRSSTASVKKHSISTNSNTNSSKSIKDPAIIETPKITPPSKQERSKVFKMEEEYDFYDMDYEEEEDSDEENKIEAIPEDQEEQEKHEKEVKQVQSKPYEKDKYTKPIDELKKSQKAKFTQLADPIKAQNQVPIEEAIINLKQSVKLNNQKLNTIKNELSNIDFEISSSEDEFQKTVEKPQQLPIMKKKPKNPAHVLITDKINDLRQNLELILTKDVIERLMVLSRNKKGNPTRTEIEKIVGNRLGAFHLANQIVKLETLLERVPLYQ